MNALTWIDGSWVEGNPPLLGPMTHSTWLGSLVFDGARRINGKFPDLDLHCERLISSAKSMGLQSQKSEKRFLTFALKAVLNLIYKMIYISNQ